MTLDKQSAPIELLHDGELDDVGALLTEIELEFSEPTGAWAGGLAGRAPVVQIATPKRLLDTTPLPVEVRHGTRIVILAEESRTARSMLARIGVDLVVRRPFHPAALRLLILHCIYSGPEKRSSKRVGVGAAVSYRVGFWRRNAILADVSERDCRLFVAHDFEKGNELKVVLPGELAGSRTILAGRVVRVSESGDPDQPVAISLVFDPPPPRDLERLRSLVAEHADGPAVLRGSAGRKAAGEEREPADMLERRSLIAVAERRLGSSEDEPAGPAVPDRRKSERHTFERRVIALGDEATRVLLGRDISATGMRIDPTPALPADEPFQIAIHVPGTETPLVLSAEVQRDDGADGIALRFRDLSPTAEAYLNDLISNLPGMGSPAVDDEDSTDAVLISEIVEPEEPIS